MWLLFAWLAYFVGTRFFAGPETSADWGELLRTLGFSTAPGVLRIIPLLNFFVFFWMIVTAVVAVRQALDFTTGRVVQASGITWRAPGFPGFEPGPDHPVVLVSWNDAQAFCAWLSRREGRRYGLPTEAQWEYAARGGTKSAWWTGDDPAALREAANIADAALVDVMPARREAEPWSDRAPFLAPVGSYAPNPFGLYDMHGNVWEWCEDEWDEAYFLRATDHDPLATGEGGFRAIRGGGWLDAAERASSAQRVWFDPTFRYCLLSGFRVVVELDLALGAP